MLEQDIPPAQQVAALALLKQLRRIDEQLGVRNSRIAFDVAMRFFEGPRRPGAAEPPAGPAGMSVDQVADGTQYSGPTVRLVLKRLIDAGTVAPSRRLGKTQFYDLTAAGRAAFTDYILALLAFHADAQPDVQARGRHDGRADGHAEGPGG
jgi:DNA-binding MarR family transcriptional regulator